MRSTGSVKLLSVAAIAVLLTACATTNTPPPPEMAKPTPIDVRLGEMSADVRAMLIQLNSLEQSRQRMAAPPKSIAEELPADHILMRRVSLTMRGEAVAAIQRVATQVGMSSAVIGVSPVQSLVFIDAVNEPLARVLEDIGMQLGNVAEIAYVERDNSIELRYKGAADKMISRSIK